MSLTSTPMILKQSTALADDRRENPRLRRKMIAEILDLAGREDGAPCVTEDISEDGLLLHVPVSYGMIVGQRCEVVLRDEPGLGEPSQLCGERRYATVVRTAPIVNSPTPMVGAGLRFDQPLFL